MYVRHTWLHSVGMHITDDRHKWNKEAVRRNNIGKSSDSSAINGLQRNLCCQSIEGTEIISPLSDFGGGFWTCEDPLDYFNRSNHIDMKFGGDTVLEKHEPRRRKLTRANAVSPKNGERDCVVDKPQCGNKYTILESSSLYSLIS